MLRRICIYCGRYLGDIGSGGYQGDTSAICDDCWPGVQRDLAEFVRTMNAEENLIMKIKDRLKKVWG